MYQKNCDRCNRPSFSSSEIGSWLCPICGNDLTALPFFDAMTLERIHVNIMSKHKKIESYEKSYTSFKSNIEADRKTFTNTNI